MRCVKINVNGVVQGVGFRPFVYRIAHEHSLRGYVKNLGDAGVEILVEGSSEKIEIFLQDLKGRAPSLARVENIRVEELPPHNFANFSILESTMKKSGGESVIPPDVAVCEDCLRELFDPDDRRHMYPFIVCTNCGPRFSIMESLPYDRKNTSMRDFPMCDECREEYEDPMDRRYHAEPVCCEQCGPHYWLVDGEGNDIRGNPIENAAKLIDEGKIIAIKGIGGFHIACDATRADVVAELRRRLGRAQQPFAVMVKDVEELQKFANLNENERKELESYRRPIVLLRKKEPFTLPESLAPGLHTIGVMLPYAPVHYLLFHYSRTPVYVMTSANFPDAPMIKDNERIWEMKEVVDYFLLHNRRIVNRVDDSVVRFSSDRAVLRRSRGFVPLPAGKCGNYNGIALGAELMNSFAVIKNGRVYPGQYIGNTSNIDVLDFLKDALGRFRALLSFEAPDLVIVDSHPLYGTSQLGVELGNAENVEILRVQHHKAHVASIMLENGVDEIIGMAVDAVGYGSDGKTWGGEVFSLTPSGIKRLTHISYYPLPGGDLASYYPLRSLMGLLYAAGEDIEKIVRKYCPESIASLKYGEKEFEMIIKQLESGLNVAWSSSTGRFLDAVAVLLNIAYRRTYEGEPAMKLESAAMGGNDLNIDIPREREIEAYAILPQLIGKRRRDAAYSVHIALARAFAERAVWHAEQEGIKNVGVSGGVAYNSIIMNEIRRIVESNGLRFLTTHEIPRGDNGISSGQAYLGAMYLEGKLRRDEIG